MLYTNMYLFCLISEKTDFNSQPYQSKKQSALDGSCLLLSFLKQTVVLTATVNFHGSG